MTFEIPEGLHEDLYPLAWLLGTWHGNGRAEYPGTGSYAFEEEIAFAHDGRDFLHYFSRSWVTDEAGMREKPGSLETGFLRVVGRPDDSARERDLELVLARQEGYAQIWYGKVDGPRLTIATDLVARTQSAAELTAAQRMYGLVEGDLMYAYDEAAEGQPMQSRTWARLSRL